MKFWNTVLEVITTYWSWLLTGVGYTMLISLLGTIFGLLIGILIGVIRTVPCSKKKWVRAVQKIINFILSAYIEIFRGTPMMVQAMVIYWGFALANGGSTLPLLPSGIFIVSINTGAYISEIVRGGIISIDRGQFEGAQSIGMNHVQTMFCVIIPQVMRNILPAVSNEFVINVKDTSVLNVIGVVELYRKTSLIAAKNAAIFPDFIIASVIYFILTFTITRFLRLLERHLEGKNNYTIYGSQTDPAAEIHIKQEERNIDA